MPHHAGLVEIRLRRPSDTAVVLSRTPRGTLRSRTSTSGRHAPLCERRSAGRPSCRTPGRSRKRQPAAPPERRVAHAFGAQQQCPPERGVRSPPAWCRALCPGKCGYVRRCARRDPAGTKPGGPPRRGACSRDRKSTRLNSSHSSISYAVFCLKKKKKHDADYAVDKTKTFTAIKNNCRERQ